MKKLKLEIEALEVETFEPTAGREEHGTVRGYLTAYYELCQPGDTWQRTCTCEPTCNAQTCYTCGGAACQSAGCTGGACTGAACTGTCNPINFTVDPTSCQPECR